MDSTVTTPIVSTIVATMSDGSQVTLFPVPTVTSTPVVTPTDVEVDLVLSDGSTKTFVPKV